MASKFYLPSLFIPMFLIYTISFAEAGITTNPCDGTSIFTYINRPNSADNACTVPNNKILAEMGYENLDLIGEGSAQDFLELTVHFGLPYDSEFIAITPNYNIQSVEPKYGFSATTFGLKHKIGHTENLVAAIEGYITVPSGSNDFGSDGTGATINGIISYDISDQLNLSLMLGASNQTLPQSSGGQHYNSINPDLVFTWQITNRIQTYGEVYGQSQTGPHEKAGFNADCGILFLIKNNIEIDLEAASESAGT